MGEPNKIAENSGNSNFTKDKHGNCFAKGHTIGRMKKKGFTLTDLNKLIRKYEKDNGEPLLKHYIAQLFKDNRLLEKYIDKNVPTKNEIAGPGGGPITYQEYFPALDPEDKKKNE